MPTIIDGTTGIDKVQDGVITNDSITSVEATKLTGTVPTARLGSGTANDTTFLRGDGSWQTISVTPSTADVLAATAGASVGAVGTYAWLQWENNFPATASAGTTTAGSNLRYGTASLHRTTYSSARGWYIGTPAGTWRIMGAFNGNGSSNTGGGHSLWLRIS